MENTIRLAHRFGRRVGSELQIPVFLYGYAARHVDRVNLPSIRRPQFEGLRDRIGADPAWTPDFGPEQLHPTAGATAVGARTLLVAYNIFLDTEDVAIAKAIATTIRTSSGGLPAVQARGFLVAGQAQVSMNLLDIDITPPILVFAAVQRGARPYGVAVARSEIVGLIPERAVPARPEETLRLTEPVESRVLERRIAEVLERG